MLFHITVATASMGIPPKADLRLFQNHYKSIICEEDPYFKELVRYIHLNPLRANMVENLAKLDRYRYCGHSVLMGKVKNDWQDRIFVNLS